MCMRLHLLFYQFFNEKNGFVESKDRHIRKISSKDRCCVKYHRKIPPSPKNSITSHLASTSPTSFPRRQATRRARRSIGTRSNCSDDHMDGAMAEELAAPDRRRCSRMRTRSGWAAGMPLGNEVAAPDADRPTSGSWYCAGGRVLRGTLALILRSLAAANRPARQPPPSVTGPRVEAPRHRSGAPPTGGLAEARTAPDSPGLEPCRARCTPPLAGVRRGA
jgi:hypothetical protein